jgi:hypothetical protein
MWATPLVGFYVIFKLRNVITLFATQSNNTIQRTAGGIKEVK